MPRFRTGNCIGVLRSKIPNADLPAVSLFEFGNKKVCLGGGECVNLGHRNSIYGCIMWYYEIYNNLQVCAQKTITEQLADTDEDGSEEIPALRCSHNSNVRLVWVRIWLGKASPA